VVSHDGWDDVTIRVIRGARPAVDGALSGGEWGDAALVTFASYGGTDSVWVKYDGDTLYAAFKNPNTTATSANQLFFDTAHDTAGLPQADDYRLNYPFSSPAFENQGNGGGWASQPATGWRASGGAAGGCLVSEFAVSFAKLGITAGVPKVLGCALYDAWTSGGDFYWPPAAFWTDPSTWALLYSPDDWAASGVAGRPSDPAPARPFALYPACPNPARTATAIAYQLPRACEVRLEVYNLAGQLVQRRDEGRQQAGRHTLQLDVRRQASGVYFCRLRAGACETTRKLVVVK
jgi:hypothetical protein